MGMELCEAARLGDSAKIRTLIEEGADVSYFDKEGLTPLMHAAKHGHADVVKSLLEAGAPWNALSPSNLSAGDLAMDLGHQDAFDLLLNAGIQAELVLGTIARAASGNSGSNVDYLEDRVSFGEDKMMDTNSKAIMMAWEKPLMEAHAKAVCSKGGHILNIGFGMGLVDTAIQQYGPISHTIVEAHSDVYDRMLRTRWGEKDNVKIIHGRWQDILSQLESYDGIFFDTYGEYYEDLREFHRHLPALLKPDGIYSFFNGLCGEKSCTCMSSASELFYNRRSRIGRIDTELRFGSSSLDRNLHNNHRHSRRRHHQGQNVDDCDPLRRSPHVRHLCHREDESVHLDNGTSQSATGNSSHLEASSSRANRLRYVQNDRLPGAVLLARERLVERLRGVSLTGNRQSRGVSSAISWDEVAYNDDFGLVDAGEWETETPREWFVGVGVGVGGTPFTDSSTQTDLFSTSMKPPGLSREEVNCLHRVVFNKKEEDDGLVAALGMVARECSICLERFQEGDGLICLPCGHRFHSACLDPWVRTCGDCPYCRTSIILDHQKARKRTLATLH